MASDAERAIDIDADRRRSTDTRTHTLYCIAYFCEGVSARYSSVARIYSLVSLEYRDVIGPGGSYLRYINPACKARALILCLRFNLARDSGRREDDTLSRYALYTYTMEIESSSARRLCAVLVLHF